MTIVRGTRHAGRLASTWVLVVLWAIGGASGCAQGHKQAIDPAGGTQTPPAGAHETPAPDPPVPPAAPTAEPTATPAQAPRPPVEPAPPAESANTSDWVLPNLIMHESRWFEVRCEGRRIGQVHYTVTEFDLTRVLRTGLEYFLFPDAEGQHGHWYWARFYSSVTTQGKPVSSWVTGTWGKTGFNHRLKAAKGGATFRRNLFGETLSEQPVGIGQTFLLPAQYIEKAMGTVGSPGDKFRCQRLAWDIETRALLTDTTAAYPSYTYTYEGLETVKGADGKEIAARKFREVPDGNSEQVSYLWLDDTGQPVRRLVPYALNFELSLCTEEVAKNGQTMTWSQAEELFGERATTTTQPARGDL
ncbi:MAG: hypothetical protein GY842_00405 [bacterium]|nr:hypothetical protein [bacterium]